MNPSAESPSMGDQEELIRSSTITMTAGPGFMLRQATDILMEEYVAGQLGKVMRNQQLEGQQQRLRSGIEDVAAEVIRVTKVMGTSLTDLAVQAHESETRIVDELKTWKASLEARIMPKVKGLSEQIRSGDVVKTVSENCRRGGDRPGAECC